MNGQWQWKQNQYKSKLSDHQKRYCLKIDAKLTLLMTSAQKMLVGVKKVPSMVADGLDCSVTKKQCVYVIIKSTN